MARSNKHDSRPPVAPGAGATVNEWLAYLEAIHPTEIDLGLDRVLVVLRRLFPRKPDARIITVAGTNGKGSTVATIERLLLASGRKAGAYTSPHLQVYNERVRLNGRDVEDRRLVAAFERVEEARRNVSLTYFEFGTLAAFVVFDAAGVEDWILEVGLGGRLDAVNVLDPDLAIITSVDIDHVAFLGDNREAIGFEKAGILRPGIPAVCADTDPPKSVLQQAEAQKVELALVGRDYHLEEARGITGSPVPSVLLQIGGWQVELPDGPLPVSSVAAAVVAMRRLEPDITERFIEKALAGLRVPGRFEQLGERPAVFVDVGHNPHAARWLASRLMPRKHSGHRVLAVYAALADKDIDGVFAAMKSIVDRWWLSGLDVPRGLSAIELFQRAGELGIMCAEQAGTVTDAIRSALAEASPGDTVIVFGSFFTVAEARALLAHPSARRRLDEFLDENDREELFAGDYPAVPRTARASNQYAEEHALAQRRTGEQESMVVMKGACHGTPVIACAFEYGFMGGTMGAVVGDLFARAASKALEDRLPLVCFSASEGARLEEGIGALMQMAKTAAAVEKLRREGIPYISVLANRVSGEVWASLAVLGDLNIAESGVKVSMAPLALLEQEAGDGGAQLRDADHLLKHGAVDMVIDRLDMRASIGRLLAKFPVQHSQIHPEEPDGG
ncbi:bifunctional tetrahydrofolate synthase/dihydrofolate synthase [Marinobacter salinisoli]|uniref:Dihydrofolate synthase/folylpolyglutamate synthase n=1 Tax=Marinobacter salinisoli TaxID=2769486 RepID=A0ABX7MQR0_9GAMM|nr:bifunctional tetrahydrofolate synthase/dihydrofolate synthase [Marinobacter salinisoli]QSP93755.1 bifunctional tetrahydrofolate synthase/dihydrofolate synthase [Marinobacter salinisoli]